MIGKKIPSWVSHYGVAFITVLATVFLILLSSPSAFSFFIVAVVISAVIGGPGSALLACLLAVLSMAYLSLAKGLSFDLLQIIALLLVTGIVSLFDRLLRQNAFRSQYERFQQIYDSNLVGIMVAGSHKRLIEANEAFLDMIGYTRADLKAGLIYWDKITPPEWKDADDHATIEIQSRNVSLPYQKEFFRKDGSRIPVLIAGARSKSPQRGTIAYAIDLTIQKYTEKELRRTNDQLEIILRCVQDSISAQLPDGYLIYANEATARLLGYSTVSEILRQPITQIRARINILDQAGHVLPAANLISLGAYQEKKSSESILRFQNRETSEDRWVQVRSTPVFDDEKNVQFVVNVIHDMTDQRRALESLLESEARFRTMANTAPVMIWVADETAKPTFFNKSWLDFINLTLEEAVSGMGQAQVHPDDLGPGYGAYLTAFAEHVPFHTEFRLKRFDSQYRWILGSAIPRFTENGTFVGYIGSAIDITEHKRVLDIQEFLIKASTSLASSLDYEEILSALVKMAIPKIADWCSIYMAQADHTIRLLVAAHVDPLKTPLIEEIRQRYPANDKAPYGVAHVLRTGQSEFYPDIDQESLMAAAHDATHVDMIQRLGFVSYITAPLTARGRILGAIQFTMGDSGRHYDAVDLAFIEELANRAAMAVDNARLYREMQAGREQLQVTLSSIADAVIATDGTGAITFMNPVAESLTGYSQHEVGGQPLSKVLHIHDEDLESLIAKITQGAVTLHITDTLLVSKDGREIPVDESAAPIRNDKHEVIGVILVFHDITEQKQAEARIHKLNAELEQRVLDRTEQLEQSNKELEAFSYSISHDLRAPLRAINGFSRIVHQEYGEKLPPDAMRLLNVIADNATQMGSLIDHLLEFSRLNRKSLDKQPVDLRILVQRVLDDLSHEVKDRQVEFIIGDFPPCEGDATLLRQVLVNLVTNALKFTRDREKTVIEIGSKPGEFPGEIAYFVKDNGIGFDQAYVNKLFGVFQRLHTADQFEGNGVGLAIVQRIIHRHGGRVWAEGVFDQGATFYFTLGGFPPPQAPPHKEGGA